MDQVELAHLRLTGRGQALESDILQAHAVGGERPQDARPLTRVAETGDDHYSICNKRAVASLRISTTVFKGPSPVKWCASPIALTEALPSGKVLSREADDSMMFDGKGVKSPTDRQRLSEDAQARHRWMLRDGLKGEGSKPQELVCGTALQYRRGRSCGQIIKFVRLELPNI